MGVGAKIFDAKMIAPKIAANAYLREIDTLTVLLANGNLPLTFAELGCVARLLS
jgi:hypothetical protein